MKHRTRQYRRPGCYGSIRLPLLVSGETVHPFCYGLYPVIIIKKILLRALNYSRANLISRSSRAGKSSPAAAAPWGSRLVGVMPGMVLVSST